MLLTINSSQFNIDNIIIGDKTKNNIIKNSYFYPLKYSNKLYTTTNIPIGFNIKCNNIEHYYNKFKCNFSNIDNIDTINQIIYIEHNILKYLYNIYNKLPQYNLKEQLSKNYIKLVNNSDITTNKDINIDIILKISGIWVDDDNYGITYKFQIINQ
jgi:hypothetical protein